jgi:hypothetical protein
MYGTKAKELLLEMRRAEGVPAYNVRYHRKPHPPTLLSPS